jgi:hypothetical protein
MAITRLKTYNFLTLFPGLANSLEAKDTNAMGRPRESGSVGSIYVAWRGNERLFACGEMSATGQTGGVMKLITSLAILVVVSFAGMDVIQANWLDDAWNESSSARHGTPSITIGAAGEVSVVLPRAVLQEAYAAGATTQDALRAFLGRYGPRLCSHLMSLNLPQKNVKVELRLLEAPLEGAEVFVASPEHNNFVLDHIPANTIRCIVPGENPAS